MTLPDDLAEAAVKEYARYTGERMTKRQVDGVAFAVATVLRALPECEEVRQVLRDAHLATLVYVAEDGNNSIKVRSNGDAAGIALAAIAKLADDA